VARILAFLTMTLLSTRKAEYRSQRKAEFGRAGDRAQNPGELSGEPLLKAFLFF
jgi:hypothetical protein